MAEQRRDAPLDLDVHMCRNPQITGVLSISVDKRLEKLRDVLKT